MKILFLDIDGVLCTARSNVVYDKEGARWYAWDPLACQAVRMACEKGVKIVVSSTWRHEKHKAHLDAQLQAFGLFDYLHADWRTIDIAVRGEWNDNNCRGVEIKDWLDRHPETTSYRILDDIPQFLPEHMPFFIHTDMDNGMDSDNIRALLRWARYLKS